MPTNIILPFVIYKILSVFWPFGVHDNHVKASYNTVFHCSSTCLFPRGVLPSPKLVVSFSLMLVVTSGVTLPSLENCVSTIVQVCMRTQIIRNND